MVGGKVVPGTDDGMTSDLTSWSVVVLPDEFLRPGKLLYFSAFFVKTTPVYLQIWRPDNTSNQLVLHYNKKLFPRAANQIETVGRDLSEIIKWSGHLEYAAIVLVTVPTGTRLQ